MTVSRRDFLSSSAAVATGFCGLQSFLTPASAVRNPSRPQAAGYGRLVEDPEGILDLPRGFSYAIVSRAGDPMDDGLIVPHSPDGMAAFPGPDGLTVLVRNHELTPDQPGPFGKKNRLRTQIEPNKLYDPGHGRTPGAGGTTNVVFDTRQQRVVRQFLSLAGTWRNCAGGPTPWGTWITCEETVARPGSDRQAERDHGYVFEVPAGHEAGITDPVPLKGMGRYNHEAVAVDKRTGIVYLTEDRHEGLLYRFLPNRPGRNGRPGVLSAGGTLQALKISGHPSADTRNWSTGNTIDVGQKLAVQWQDLDDVESPRDDLRFRGFAAGAARFARGEGMWPGDDEIYFACTNGGSAKKGQIWRYVPSPSEGQPEEAQSPGRLELFVEPNDSALVENADNLTIAPWGDLIVCEDRSGDVVRLVGVTPDGRLYTFAHNHRHSEFAGATFSPDGSTLFVNIQKAGLTLAITGPWNERPA